MNTHFPFCLLLCGIAFLAILSRLRCQTPIIARRKFSIG